MKNNNAIPEKGDARKTFDEVKDAVRQFPEIARRNEVPEALIGEIASYLTVNGRGVVRR